MSLIRDSLTNRQSLPGSMSAWMIRVTDGKPQGSPDLVKPDIGQIIPIGFTPAVSFYYGLAIGTGDVYTAEFDPATGRVLTEPQIATQRYVGWNVSPAWSPDGQYLAYISRNRHKIITIRSLKTSEERDLSPKLPFMWGPIRWSPDGRSILVSGKDGKARHGEHGADVGALPHDALGEREADAEIGKVRRRRHHHRVGRGVDLQRDGNLLGELPCQRRTATVSIEGDPLDRFGAQRS